MTGMNYFDPLYGAVKLDDIFRDLLSQKELLRLQSIGLMNFRSLSKLSLTSISRLEHSIGTAILFDIMSYKNNNLKSRYNDYICAALYHDISCASFGHAVEWAISRYKKFDHVEQTSWLVNNKLTINLDKPLGIGSSPSGAISKEILKKHNISSGIVESIIKGNESCVICDKAMDLDNIDNVSRMALYMGIEFDRKLPLKLATCLNVTEDRKYFLINSKNIALVEEWLDLRFRVYREFIYSSDYMAYEFMIFLLIKNIFLLEGEVALNNVRHMTDEELLSNCLSSGNEVISSIASKMKNYDLPECVAIVSSEDVSYKEFFNDVENYNVLKNEIIETIKSGGLELSCADFDIHITTDYRKTNRLVEIVVDNEIVSIGSDLNKVLFGIIVNNTKKVYLYKDIISAAIGYLSSDIYKSKVEEIFITEVNQSLFDD